MFQSDNTSLSLPADQDSYKRCDPAMQDFTQGIGLHG